MAVKSVVSKQESLLQKEQISAWLGLVGATLLFATVLNLIIEGGERSFLTSVPVVFITVILFVGSIVNFVITHVKKPN